MCLLPQRFIYLATDEVDIYGLRNVLMRNFFEKPIWTMIDRAHFPPNIRYSFSHALLIFLPNNFMVPILYNYIRIIYVSISPNIEGILLLFFFFNLYI